MSELLFIAYDNPRYRNALLAAGYALREIDPQNPDDIVAAVRGAAVDSFVVVDVAEDNAENLRRILSCLTAKNLRVVAVGGPVSETTQSLLLAEGVADYLRGDDPARLARYLRVLQNPLETRASQRDGFIILEDDAVRRAVFRAIIGRYGYAVEMVSTIDDFFRCVNGAEHVAALVNLGAAGFDVSRFVRGAHACAKIKQLPVVPYKDAKEGIFVHEMTSGLNRITRVILSPDEAYSFLVNMLFRGELFPCAGVFNGEIKLDEHAAFMREPFQRIFYTMGVDVFTMENIVGDTDYDRMVSCVDSLRRACVRVDGLRWLVKNNHKVATCGVPGVYTENPR